MKSAIRVSMLLLLLSGFSQAQTPKIIWAFDTRDMSAGQSAMDDIDNDGKYEIVFGCYRNDSMIYAINAENGSLHWKYKAAGSGDGCNDVASLIFDIDGDGFKEVIVPSSCYPRTYCFDGASGIVKWVNVTRGSHSPPVIADFDGDDTLDLFVVGGYSEYPNFSVNYGRGYAIQAGKGAGPDWKMFQRDYYRSCSYCYTGQIISNVGSNDISRNFLFNIHPVPLGKNSILHININVEVENLVRLFDISGKLIHTTVNPQSIDLSELDLQQGVYLIKCSNVYGESTRKIVITGR